MPYSPKIHKVTNGWIVEAGCMTLVFENDERLIDEFARWIRRPEMVEKEYIEKFGGIPVDPRQPGAEARIRRDDIHYDGHYDHGDCVTGVPPDRAFEVSEVEDAPPPLGTHGDLSRPGRPHSDVGAGIAPDPTGRRQGR